MISISVGLVATPMFCTGLTVSGLTDGAAREGDVVSVTLTDGSPIVAYRWGSSTGADDFGTQETLTIPANTDGSTIFVSVDSATQTFTVNFPVLDDVAPPTTTITPGPEEIFISTMAPIPDQPDLAPFPDLDTIRLEIA